MVVCLLLLVSGYARSTKLFGLLKLTLGQKKQWRFNPQGFLLLLWGIKMHCILKKTRLLFICSLLYFGVFVVLSLLYNCSQPEEIERLPAREKKENYLIEGPIFTVSYNEIFQQPNWITYQVRDIVKVADRGNRDFYEVDSVYTSNDADYYANPWDKGHMAPAAAFTDSVENLHETFSYLNCALQRDDLNRGE